MLQKFKAWLIKQLSAPEKIAASAHSTGAAGQIEHEDAQGSAVAALPLAISTTSVALSLLLLAARVLPQGTAMRLVCVNMQVQGFMTYWQLAGDLLRAPLQPQERTGVAAQLRAFAGKFKGLFGSVASTPSIAAQLATDRGLAASKQSGNLRDVVLGFLRAVNLISFNLAEVFVIHRATSTCRSGSFEC